jgi:hypothetical protein
MPGLPKVSGKISCQAAIFIYKDDPTAAPAWLDVQKISNAEREIHAELHSEKASLLQALSLWNQATDSNGSFLCIYSHAGPLGINAVSGVAESRITWSELAAALPLGARYIWLLGCETEHALSHWSALAGPVKHRLLATDASKPWRPFLKFFASEIGLDPIRCDDEMTIRLRQQAPELAKHTRYFGPDLARL